MPVIPYDPTAGTNNPSASGGGGFSPFGTISNPFAANPFSQFNPANTGSPYASAGALQQPQTTPDQTFVPPPGDPNGPANVFTGVNSQQMQALGSQGTTPTTTPGDDLYNNLLQQLAGMASTPTDTASLSGLAQQEAGLKYDPLISQLQNNLGMAQTNESTASKNIGDLYSSLGKSIAAQLPGITQQYNAQEDQARGNYANLQNQIAQNYQGAQQAQAAELQKLGIQAALPQSTQQLTRDQSYQQSQASNNSQALQGALGQMGQGQQDFMQRASAIAPMTGANVQAALATQLLNLQNNTNNQIAGYKGQEGADAQSLLMQLEQQAQANATKNQSSTIAQTKNLAELQNLVHPGIFGVKPTAATAKYKGFSGQQQYLADNSAVADPTQLYSDLTALQNDKSFQQLTGPGGTGSPNLQTAWPVLQQLVQQIDPQTYANNAAMTELFNALAIQYGKY